LRAELKCAIVILNAIKLWSILSVLSNAPKTLIICNGNHERMKISTMSDIFKVILISLLKSVRWETCDDCEILSLTDDGGVPSAASFFSYVGEDMLIKSAHNNI
jgi:hypothetical protein